MYESILVPTDGSEGAEAALDRAIDLATLFNADLHFLRVVDTEQFSVDEPDEEVAELLDAIENEGRETVSAYEERARVAGVDYTETAVRRGVPHEEIVDYTADHDFELIVVGSYGERGYEPGRLGGVAEAVTSRVDEPVLVV